MFLRYKIYNLIINWNNLYNKSNKFYVGNIDTRK